MDLGVHTPELFGIAKRCPFGEPVPNCPLAQTRKLPLRQRHDSICALSPAQARQVLAHHTYCASDREQLEDQPQTDSP
jgi:hypothetical protein